MQQPKSPYVSASLHHFHWYLPLHGEFTVPGFRFCVVALTCFAPIDFVPQVKELIRVAAEEREAHNQQQRERQPGQGVKQGQDGGSPPGEGEGGSRGLRRQRRMRGERKTGGEDGDGGEAGDAGGWLVVVWVYASPVLSTGTLIHWHV
jgi:hypothetical protein